MTAMRETPDMPYAPDVDSTYVTNPLATNNRLYLSEAEDASRLIEEIVES